MKHFIAFATLGIAAVGSGMALAAHFAMPGSQALDMDARLPSASGMRDVSLPAMPRQFPDARGAMQGAESAFGKATGTMAYYSDRAFGSTAMKVKRSADQVRLPAAH